MKSFYVLPGHKELTYHCVGGNLPTYQFVIG